MSYKGNIEIINGFVPKNNGDFPLVEAKDVYVDDNTRLDDALDEVVLVQDTEPTESANKIWVNTSSDGSSSGGVVVPTYEEYAALRDDLAKAFDASKSYAVGDFVLYDNVIYKCTTAVTTAGAWTGATNWTKTELGTGVGDLKNDISDLKQSLSENKTQNFVDVADRINNVSKIITVDNIIYEQGSILFTYIENKATDRIRSMPITIGTQIGRVHVSLLKTGYDFFVSIYDKYGNGVYQDSWRNTDWTMSMRPEYGYIKVTIRKSDNSDITPDEGIDVVQVDLYPYRNNLRNAMENIELISAGESPDIHPWFSYGQANGGRDPVRASTDFIKFNGYFEVYEDTQGEPKFFLNLTLYDENMNAIGNEYANVNVGCIRYIIPYDHILADKIAYVKVYLKRYDGVFNQFTDELIDYANEHIFIRHAPKVRDYEDVAHLSVADFERAAGTNNDEHGDKDYYYYYYLPRRITNDFYKVKPGSRILLAQNVSDLFFGIRYFNDDFSPVEDTNYLTNVAGYTELKDYPYMKILMRIADNEDIPDSDVEKMCGLIVPDATITYGTIYGSGAETPGEYYTIKIRAVTRDKIWIDDAYIKFNEADKYNFQILFWNDDDYEGYQGWYTANLFGYTDNAIRVQHKYIRILMALSDRTAVIPADVIMELNEHPPFEIIESIGRRAVGQEVENGYPYYYNDEMDQTVDTACEKSKYDAVKFCMITDLHDNDHAHLSETTEAQINAIKELHNRVGLDFVICGGDLTDGGYSSKEELLDKFTTQVQAFKKIGVPVIFERGNHDDNSYAGPKNVSHIVSREEFYARCVAPFSGHVIPSGKMYYYRDFEDVNTRVISLDFIDYPWIVDTEGNLTWYAGGGDKIWRGYSDEQIVWLLETALKTDKRIIVTGHYSTHPNLMTAWEKSTDHNYTVVNQAMIAYNNRGTVTFGGKTYSFADRKGKVLAEVTGHSHSFGAFIDNGIVWSTTGSPSPEVTNRVFDDTAYETMGERSYGNITEAHFNLFICDENQVDIISFGQMGDLSFTLGH